MSDKKVPQRAVEAAKELSGAYHLSLRENAEIISRHFEPLERELANLKKIAEARESTFTIQNEKLKETEEELDRVRKLLEKAKKLEGYVNFIDALVAMNPTKAE
jgi:predicted secreted protein